MAAVQVYPATPDRWNDVVTVMGTRGDPARCWCQYFHLRGREWSDATPASLRERLCHQVTSGAVAPGLLAYVGDGPVGWCQVGPKSSFARLATSKSSSPPTQQPDPDHLWSITCFVVTVRARRRGVARALLDGAVAHAGTHGAAWVEAYAVDTDAKASVSSAELYHGSLAMFLSAGFAEVRRPSPARVVMRIQPRVA